MIKIQDVVSKIIEADEEALFAVSKGYMNLSAYAKKIQVEVENKSFKKVTTAGIVVALSRFQKKLKNIHPFIQDIKINNITIKSPLTEMVFEKTPKVLSQLSSLYSKLKTGNDDFLTMTVGTNEVTIICSDRIKAPVTRHFKEKPRHTYSGLASMGLSLDAEYYTKPNVTFSLLRKIAQKKIVLAETITNFTEIIFIFQQKYIGDITQLFSVE